MRAKIEDPQAHWIGAWLDGVADGSSSMSQRKLTVIQKRAGGIATVRRAAKRRGVHLLLLQDDRGDHLIAANMKRFKVIC